MKILQALVYFLVLVAILVVGILLVFFELHELYEMATQYIPDDSGMRYGVAAGSMVIGSAGLFLFVLGLRGRSRNSRKIEFQSKHGYIVIELDSVQNSLQKAMSKLPEVKSISLQVLPSDNDRKVRIVADAVVNKPPGAGIRETASNLEDKLAASAKRMLGVEDIASLDLNISRVLMNVKKEFDTTLDDNRLLEHQAAPAPAPAAQAPAAAPAPVEAAPAPAPVADPPKSEAGLDASPSASESSNGGTGDTSESEPESSKGFWR